MRSRWRPAAIPSRPPNKARHRHSGERRAKTTAALRDGQRDGEPGPAAGCSAVGIRDELSTAVRTRLGENGTEVVVDGLLSYAQAASDPAGISTGHELGHDLRFSGRQAYC